MAWLFLFLAFSEPGITALILMDKDKFAELKFRTIFSS